jgi:PAS domain S-box-containing protein
MPLLPPAFAAFQRWATAIAIAVVAWALQWAVQAWTGTAVPFLFFLPGVVVAAVLAGRPAGLFVAAAGLVAALRWLPPVSDLWASDTGDLISIVVYALFAGFLAAFGARQRRSTARAEEAEQRLVLAVEDTRIGIFDIDLVGRTAWLSPTLAALAGLDQSGVAPIESVLSRLPPEHQAESRAVLAQKLRERARSYERELQVLLPDGRPHWLLLRVHIVWSGERAVRLRGACVDITERKTVDALLDQTKAELSQQVADLRRLHEMSTRLLETASLPEQLQMILIAVAHFHGARRGLVSLYEPQTRTMRVEASLGFDVGAVARLAGLKVTDGACGLACLKRERVVVADIEAPVDTVGDPDMAECVERLRAFAREQGFRAIHSTPMIGPSGDALGAVSIHFDEPRTPTERERTLADICARKAAIYTERARAEFALEESRGRFRAVLDSSAVPFVVLAPVREPTGGRITDFSWSYVNDAAARVLRRPPHAFEGKKVLDVLPDRWRSSPTFDQYVAVAEKHETREFEAHVMYEGADQWFHCVASPMRGDVALWFSDVTERKLAEQSLQEADRRKDEFLATLAHELRNPLAPIRQAAALSRNPIATEIQKRWSHEVIERQVAHMALLLDDLLDVSRISRGALALRRGTHELGAILDAAIETARPLVDARRHTLEIVAPSAPIELEVDPLRVAQIVANLLTNAAKYTEPAGRIRLTAALDGEDVVIEVGDNGIGIAPESLPAVFDMFTQLRGASDRAGGLGIGLALTKGLVELHGGSIAVRSDGPGQGSLFTVRLPRGDGTLPTPAPVAKPAPAPARHVLDEAPAASIASSPRAHAHRRVLIADDNRDAAESLAALLELEGHEVALAFDGDDALRAFDRFRPEVCLLDIGMPHRSGNDVARSIRGQPGGAAPTLIAITGWGQETDRREALGSGFDHHLTKPVDPVQLLHIIASEPVAAPA